MSRLKMHEAWAGRLLVPFRNAQLGNIQSWLMAGLFWGAIAPATPAADQLTLKAGPLSETIALEELEQFSQTGKLSPDLQKWSPLLTPELGELLGQELALEPQIAQQFLDNLFATRDGQRLLEELHQALPGSSPEQIQASLYGLLQQENISEDPNLSEESDSRAGSGITPLRLMRVYPEATLQVDLLKAGAIAWRLNRPRWQSQALRPMIERTLAHASAPETVPDFAHLGIDPGQPGPQAVRQRSLTLWDHHRQRTIAVELYYGEAVRGPLVVLSHGFAADRQFMSYLAEHLASHGVSVATLEHPGSNVDVLAQIAFNQEPTEVLSAAEFVDRPRDIQFLLNALERDRFGINREQTFNTQEVVVIGHSLGGYTALALAGAELDLRALREFCQNRSPLGRAPADWLQCSAAKLPHRTLKFRDRRVIQAVAINPLIGEVFGPDGLGQLETPVMLVSHSDDTVTPTLEHQLLPFEKIPTPKQFVLITGATHMSITDTNNGNSPVAQSSLVQELMGPAAEPVRQTMRSLLLPLVNQHTEQARQYRPFLSPAYAQTLSDERFTVRLTESLPPALLQWSQWVAGWGEEQPEQMSWGDRLQARWQTLTERWQPVRYCQGQLDQIFTRLFEQEPV